MKIHMMKRHAAASGKLKPAMQAAACHLGCIQPARQAADRPQHHTFPPVCYPFPPISYPTRKARPQHQAGDWFPPISCMRRQAAAPGKLPPACLRSVASASRRCDRIFIQEARSVACSCFMSYLTYTRNERYHRPTDRGNIYKYASV